MRHAWLVLAVMSAGCGVSLRSSLDAWHPSGRVSQLDEADRALLARMVVDTPTDDAMDAREHIDELGDVGDDDVRALLSSSLRWLERVTPALESLRAGRCEATRDVAVPVPALREPAGLLGLGVLWSRDALRDEPCTRAYRALRALAITRAWVGAHCDDRGALAVFRLAVERLSGPSLPCPDDEVMQIDQAIARHFYELDPRPIVSLRSAARGCSVITLHGSQALIPHSPLAPAHRYEAAPAPSPVDQDDEDVIGALMGGGGPDFDESEAVRVDEDAQVAEVWIGSMIFTVIVARRGGEWRVVGAVYGGQVEFDTYRRG